MPDIIPETVDAKSMEGSGSKSSYVPCKPVSEDVQNSAKALNGNECKAIITTTALSNKTEAKALNGSECKPTCTTITTTALSNKPEAAASTEIQAVLKCPIKIKKEEPEPSCGPGCCCDICSVKRAASAAPVPSTSEVPQEQQTPTINNGSSQNNSGTANLPPVRIGSCLLCGDSCNGHGDDSSDEEETAATPFLPPPPMSTVEVDKLFSKLTEQDKESSTEPSSVINTEMFLHQKQALNWMINKENSQDLGPFWREVYREEWYNEGTKKHAYERPNCINGGILADDMGLGKTLTVIALIVTNHINGKPMFMKKESSKKRKASNTSVEKISQAKKSCIEVNSSSSTEDEVVIIVKKEKTHIKKEKKAIAIKKRKEEIIERKRLVEGKKSKDPGALFRKIFLKKILSKKGKLNNKAHMKKEKSDSSPGEVPSDIQNSQPSTSKTSHDMMILDDDDDDDLSLTSTKLVAASEIHLPTRLSNNRSFSASPIPSGTAKATLIICPLSVLTNWTDQICTHINPAVSLRVYMYYGGDRVRDLKYLSEQDIILTTYPTIANDFRTGSSPLHKITWLRIILDEGHTIRNKGTMLAKSVLDLEAERRWAITGTPIQNRIKDLWTLILFLRLEPFSDVTWWKTSVANLAKNNTELADFRLNTVIKHIAIRRLKDEKVGEAKIVELPPKEVVIQDIELTAEERKHYDMLQNNGQNIIRRYLRHNSVLKHYAHCFAILMRLRQMCLQPKLCKIALDELQRAVDNVQNVDDDDNDNADTADNTAHLIKILIQAVSSGDSEECSVCLEALNDPVITPCAHVFCANCITDVLNSEGLAPMCPMCRAPVDETDLIRVPEEQMRNQNKETTSNNDDGNMPGSLFENSSKITALMSSLEAIRDKDPSIKSVVVSQFTSFLNIIEEHLEKHGFQFLRLDGSMRLEERRVALERFSEPGSATVFLLSMSAGGTGISLTAATRVFLMDPAWNPAVEQQCFDRCHRMGQTQEVIITKYIVMDSVEERMLTLQDQKLQLMTHAFGSKAQSEEDKRRTRVRDIAHLIGLRPAVQRGTQ